MDDISCQIVVRTLKVPYIEQDDLAAPGWVNQAGIDLPATLRVVDPGIVAHTDQAASTSPQALVKLLKRLQNIAIRQQMGDRIIAGNQQVKLSLVYLPDMAHIRHVEFYLDLVTRGFKLSLVNSDGRQIRGGDLITQLRQTDALGNDPAGGIQNGLRLVSDEFTDQTVQISCLAEEAGIPVRVDSFIVGSQLVVIICHHMTHTSQRIKGADRSRPCHFAGRTACYATRRRAEAISSAIILRLLFSIKKLGPACK